MPDIITIEQNSDKDNLDENYNLHTIDVFFPSSPRFAAPLIFKANSTLSRIENLIYSTPTVINTIKSFIPKEVYQAVINNEQKLKMAKGSLELMTKKDGSIIANLINPKTKKIIKNIPLEKIKVTPEINEAITNYSFQMQMMGLAEQIQEVQVAIEEVRHGLEFDRLAHAYSCYQRLLQALVIKNKELRTYALLNIAHDAEDSRNLLMQSQKANLLFIKNQPEGTWKKLISTTNPEKIDQRMNAIRESLNALNIVSFLELTAYIELGEYEAANHSLQYYSEYIHDNYIKNEGLLERLDLIDPSPTNYWSENIPLIHEKSMNLQLKTNDVSIGEKHEEV